MNLRIIYSYQVIYEERSEEEASDVVGNGVISPLVGDINVHLLLDKKAQEDVGARFKTEQEHISPEKEVVCAGGHVGKRRVDVVVVAHVPQDRNEHNRCNYTVIFGNLLVIVLDARDICEFFVSEGFFE